MKRTLTVIVLLLMVNMSQADDFRSIIDVANRVAPWLKGKVQVEKVPKTAGKEYFELSTQKGKLHVKATTTSAAGMGLNYYLKYYCNRHYSHTGSNLAPVDKLPEIEKPVRVETPFKYRYFLNYCTLNYSSSFWGWKEWERELDWMSLNGVNLALATIGTEEVWLNILRRFGYTDQEILKFLPGPAFNAWFLMGNLEGWGGPISIEMVKERTKTEKKILARMCQLGIEPVYQSFYGMVPNSLKDKFSQAKIIDQGKWAGGFHRPAILLPGDSLYNAMADTYYREVKKLYGNFSYFGGEPFHEGGSAGGMNVSEATHNVQQGILKHFPKASWVLQAWGGNPSPAFLKSLDPKHTLILDLFGEMRNVWEDRKGFDGHPWVWCIVNDLGENPSMFGKLDRMTKEPFRAMNSEVGKNIAGVGAMPEGFMNNPVVFDLIFDLAWHSSTFDINEWIKGYIKARYGKLTPDMLHAWSILLQTTYRSEPYFYQEGGTESVFCARPELDLETTSSWGTSKLYYDYTKLKPAIEYFIKSIDSLGNVDAFRYDLVDFTRQIIANEGRETYYKMNAAIKAKDREVFEQQAKLFLEQIADQERLLSTRTEFMVGSWIEAAKKQGKNAADKDLYEQNARMQITIWGPLDSTTNLHEYAHKEWSGILKDLYLPRWEMFIAATRAELDGQKVGKPDYFSLEKSWVTSRNVYPTQPQDDILKVAKELLIKYSK